MKIQIFDRVEELNQAAAVLIAAQLLENPQSVLGLATGSTPIAAYQELVRMHKAGFLSFARATSFNLDEYVGLDRNHEQSYYDFMQKNLFRHVDMRPSAIHVPYGLAADPEAECAAYEAAMAAAGGVDLQLLGLGQNGHIGFNEPAADFSSVTHRVQLTDSTIEANARFFASRDEVPKEALSMGVGSILKARKILLLASGKNKAEAVRAMVEGDINPQCPASALQVHAHTLVLLDKEAASLLS